MRSKRQWAQCELAVLPGAEPWVMVRHRRGHFRLPLDASIESLLRGVQEGWTSKPAAAPQGGMITVSRGEYGHLRVDADSWNALPQDLKNALLLDLDDPGNKAKGQAPKRGAGQG